MIHKVIKSKEQNIKWMARDSNSLYELMLFGIYDEFWEANLKERADLEMS